MQQGINPREWTYENIEAMRAQLKRIGLSLDWSREFATCDPEYYHQQQRLFQAFLKAGLVYRKKSKVNWDPVDHTVLANEQVVDGRGWRSGAVVEQKELAQWFFKITQYGEELLAGLDTLDKCPFNELMGMFSKFLRCHLISLMLQNLPAELFCLLLPQSRLR